MQTIPRPRVIYDEYIRSPEWRLKCDDAKERAGHKCQLCKSPNRLTVHHNTYERLGDELPEDLIVLCRTCHEVYHAKRDERTAKKYREAEWVKRNKDRAYSALPDTPLDVIAEPPPLRVRFKREKPSTASGKIISIVITREYIESLVSPVGGITYAGLRLLGEPTPWVNGWRHRPMGKTVQVDEGELLAEQAIVAAKHNGTYVKGFDRVQGTDFTPDQIAAIRAEYATDKKCGKKSLAKKWGCGGKKIAVIIADLFELRHQKKR